MNEKKYKKYSEEFKLSVLRDYYASGMSMYAKEAWAKHPSSVSVLAAQVRFSTRIRNFVTESIRR